MIVLYKQKILYVCGGGAEGGSPAIVNVDFAFFFSFSLFFLQQLQMLLGHFKDSFNLMFINWFLSHSATGSFSTPGIVPLLSVQFIYIHPF